MSTYHVILLSTHDEYDITVDKETLNRLIADHIITMEDDSNECSREEEKR